jgi:hypothetical protein
MDFKKAYVSGPCHGSGGSGTGSIPGQVHVRFVVDKLALRQVFLRVVGFPLSISFHWCSINCKNLVKKTVHRSIIIIGVAQKALRLWCEGPSSQTKKKAYDSVRRKVLYNILIEFGIPLKLVRLVKICLNITYTRVRVGKHLSDTFPIKNGLKKGDALSPLLFNFAFEYAIRRGSDKPEGLEIKWYTSASSLC